MALVISCCYDPGPYTLLKADGKGHETHARTRGRIKNGLLAWRKILRTNYGVDWSMSWLPDRAAGAIRISVGRESLSRGGGWYNTAQWTGRRIELLSFLANDPFRTPAVLGRLVFHEWLHSRRLRLGSDKYGHANDRSDVFHANCGPLATDSLAWLLKTCGRIRGWKPPRVRTLLADDGPSITCGVGVRL